MGWATVVSCDVACHVMSLDVLVMSFDAMWLLVLCHVTWCNAMSCDVRSCEELSSVVPCNGMGCYEVKPPLFSKQLLCTTKYYSNSTLSSKYYSSTTPTTPTLLCTSKSTPVCSVLQSTTPVLLCTTKYYSSTTLYYKVLLQYYKVLLQYYNALLCTTKFYSNSTLYYKVLPQYYKVLLQYYSVLLQYDSVLQSTTPVRLRTTKYYSSTTLYYKVLLQYYSVLLQYYSSTTKYYSSTTTCYSVLQSTTPVLLGNVIYHARSSKSHPPTSPNTAPGTQNECHDWSCSHMKRYFQCAEQQESPANFTKYCAWHAKWMSWLILVTYETSFTMRGATGITLQPHQILRLPRKMNVMIDPAHVWNVIYNARSKRHHPATSPNTAPATQNCTPKF